MKKIIGIVLNILLSYVWAAASPAGGVILPPAELFSQMTTDVSLFVTDSTLVKGEMKASEAVLYFRWDRSDYEESYLDNANGAQLLSGLLSSIGTENVDSVSVVAYSSPDGNYQYNVELSRRRAEEFSNVFNSVCGGPDVPLKVRAGGEGWDLLKRRVLEDNKLSFDSKKRITRIIDNPHLRPDTKKWRFANGSIGRMEDGQSVYKYLLKYHYPYLRCLIIELHYNVEKKSEEQKPVTPLEPFSDDVVSAPSVSEEKAKLNAPLSEDEQKPDSVAGVEPAAAMEPVAELLSEAVTDVLLSPLRRPILGISTNLPYDITWVPQYGLTSIPSFSLEYYPRVGNFTFGADVEWPMWQHPSEHRYFQINNITLWTRRYFKPVTDCFSGAYLFGSVNAFRYGIGFNENKGWEGEGAGASLGAGFKYYLSKHFYLDAGLALGTFYSAYDPYVWGNDITGRYYYDYNGDPNEFKRRNKRMLWFGPTRVYISIGFDVFGKKK